MSPNGSPILVSDDDAPARVSEREYSYLEYPSKDKVHATESRILVLLFGCLSIQP